MFCNTTRIVFWSKGLDIIRDSYSLDRRIPASLQMAGFRSTAVTLNYNREHVPCVFYIITVQVLKNMQANFHSFITLTHI
jgi:hypothetical protein